MSTSDARTSVKGGGAAPAYYGLALLSTVSLLNYLDRMVIAVLVEPIKRDLGLSDTQVGLVAGFAFALLYALAGLPLARIADRSSRVKLVSICLVVWSAMTALTGMARSFVELFVARMAVGIGEAGCVPASHSLIGDMFPPHRRAFAVGVFQAGGLIGMSFGLAGAGWVAEVYGWRAALLVAGTAGVPVALLLYMTMPEPARSGQASARPTGESAMATMVALARRPALVHLVIALSIGAFATYGMSQWISAFFIRSHGLGLAAVGLYGGLAGGGGGIIGAIVGGLAMARLRPRDARWELWLPAAGYGLAAPLFAATFLLPDALAAFSLQFAATFVASAGGAVALSAIQTFAEPHRRATAIAIMLMLSSLIGLGVGPTAVGVLSDALSPATGGDSLRYALVISTAFLLWASTHYLLAARHARADATAAD
ncbi:MULTISPECIES: MFS transporter [unclassified Sphingopyxis]|uniref:spinster family MFS transporter n=1 Tax=unclassified Sphingopyxis TaxID=2614943 RepID=UPI0024ACA831|nr:MULTISPECIES: MFS transporter [unclassified Sphingopyxis]